LPIVSSFSFLPYQSSFSAIHSFRNELGIKGFRVFPQFDSVAEGITIPN
jgi:hypothetical protein